MSLALSVMGLKRRIGLCDSMTTFLSARSAAVNQSDATLGTRAPFHPADW